MPGPYQVLKFVMLDFDHNWDRMMLVIGYANIRYTATGNGGRLVVVTESTVGTLKTYYYSVAAGQEVFVVDQVIHIPARCEKSEGGNTIDCGP